MSAEKRDSDAVEVASEWWRRLASSERGVDRASMARLRRAERPLDVLFEPAALRLVARLPRMRPERVAIVAAVLAHVTESADAPLARIVGRSTMDDEHSAAVSESRFRRLLQSDGDELMHRMRRVVRMAKGRADVSDLARAILYWGDRVRRDWIFAYYAVAADRTEQAALGQAREHHEERTGDG